MVRTQESTREKVYAYKRISSETPAPAKQATYSYLYIGTEFRQHQQLHQGFTINYFVYSTTEAMKLLRRLTKSGNLPSAILMDDQTDLHVIQEFARDLRSQEAFATLPLFVEISNDSQSIPANLMADRNITDLVRITDSRTLLSKTVFQNKVNINIARQEIQLSNGINPKLAVTNGLIRAFDFAFASICILLMSPLVMLFALLLKLEGAQQIFEYVHERGLGHSTYKALRFRTAFEVQEGLADLCPIRQLGLTTQEQMKFSMDGNGRVASFLRRTNLDQLPAFFNILIGDISFIRKK